MARIPSLPQPQQKTDIHRRRLTRLLFRRKAQRSVPRSNPRHRAVVSEADEKRRDSEGWNNLWQIQPRHKDVHNNMKFEEWFYLLTLLSKFRGIGLFWVYSADKGSKEMAWVDFNEPTDRAIKQYQTT